MRITVEYKNKFLVTKRGAQSSVDFYESVIFQIDDSTYQILIKLLPK